MAASFAAMWMVPRSWSQTTGGGTAGPSVEAPVEKQTPAGTESGAETDREPAADGPETDSAAAANYQAGAGEGESQPARKKREFTARDFWLFGWLVAMGLLFYTCYTIYSVPLVSLSYEMTPDYHERTRVMAYWGFFTMAGNLLINWYYPITEQQWLFADRLTAARTVSLLVGVGIFVGLGVLPGLFVKERLYRSASKQDKIALLPAVKETLQSRNMLMLLGMTLSLAFVGAMAAALALYIVMFHVYGGDREAGSILNAWNGVGFQVVGFLSIPVLAWAATRVGKRAAMYLVLGMAAVGGVAKWFLYSPDWFVNVYLPGWFTSLGVPESWLAAPIRLHWLLLDPVLSGPIWVALGMIVPSMMADLCDVDEYEHGKRREGVFGAVFSWIQKLGFSLTFLFAGIAIWLSGFNEQLGANQPAETMFAMRLCFAGFSTLAMVIGMAFLVFYNVSEKRAYEVRAILEQRRGKIPVDGGDV
jgi:GPH family glycoside/pentoside/hexuronide:cation symporter